MTASLKSKYTSITTVRYHLLPVASLLIDPPHFSLPTTFNNDVHATLHLVVHITPSNGLLLSKVTI
jgi:hypothetical protein